MEIIILLVVMAVVSVLMYLQLKGTKNNVMPATSFAQPKKSPKKQVTHEKKEEKWDVEKKVSRNASPEDKKKSKKRFDPVAEGAKVLKPVEEAKVRERKVPKTDDEVKAQKVQKKRNVEEGFVMVEDKKPTAYAPKKEIVFEEVETTPEDDKIAQLRAIIQGQKPANFSRPESSKAPTTDGPKTETGRTLLTNQQIKEKMEARKTEEAKAAADKMVVTGTVKVPLGTTTALTTRGWGAVPKAAPAPEEEEGAAPPAAEEPPQETAADEPAAEEAAAEAADE